MLKNKEVKIMLGIMTVISVGTGYLVFPYSQMAAGISLAGCFLLMLVFLVFTKYRYQNIHKLSTYLHQIQAGEFTLDLRDNEEGELSYLKNEIYKVTVKLTEQAELLKRDKTYLADAISDISHQLKTPLTSMMMMADLLNDENLPPERREEFTSNIHRQLERIEWLVSALLKMSKLDAGTVVLKKETVRVKDLIKQSIAHLLIPMELLEQELSIRGEEEVTYIGDFSWSAEAFANIVKNCMEHTPRKGQIQIQFSENSIFTIIQIQDNGDGISKEDLPHIFKRFYKGKNAAKDSVGIGLAMARQIIVQQGGKIDVDSKEGEGTCFTIKFYKRVL